MSPGSAARAARKGSPLPRITEWTSRAVQEHQHDVRSSLGIGHADFGEQRGQFAAHSILVRDNH